MEADLTNEMKALFRRLASEGLKALTISRSGVLNLFDFVDP